MHGNEGANIPRNCTIRTCGQSGITLNRGAEITVKFVVFQQLLYSSIKHM